MATNTLLNLALSTRQPLLDRVLRNAVIGLSRMKTEDDVGGFDYQY